MKNITVFTAQFITSRPRQNVCNFAYDISKRIIWTTITLFWLKFDLDFPWGLINNKSAFGLKMAWYRWAKTLNANLSRLP